MACNTI